MENLFLIFARLISNWTNDLTLFTNGPFNTNSRTNCKLKEHDIKIIEKEVERLEHTNGILQNIIFRDGTSSSMKALYAPSPFEQHCPIPQALGCELNDEGYIKIDAFQKTTVDGVFACGDNVTRLRTVANA
jgi:thioredoxin reductase